MLTRAKIRAKSPIAKKALLENGKFGSRSHGIDVTYKFKHTKAFVIDPWKLFCTYLIIKCCCTQPTWIYCIWMAEYDNLWWSYPIIINFQSNISTVDRYLTATEPKHKWSIYAFKHIFFSRESYLCQGWIAVSDFYIYFKLLLDFLKNLKYREFLWIDYSPVVVTFYVFWYQSTSTLYQIIIKRKLSVTSCLKINFATMIFRPSSEITSSL